MRLNYLYKKLVLVFIILSTNSLILAQWFHGHENLKCKDHCKRAWMNDTFLLELKKMERKCSFEFYITSGYRCRNHNSAIHGFRESTHLQGRAVDIRWDGNQEKLNEIIELAQESNFFNRIYYNENPYNRHIHIGQKIKANNFVVWNEQSHKNIYVGDIGNVEKTQLNKKKINPWIWITLIIPALIK